MLAELFATDNDAALTMLRLAFGLIFFPHGAQKMLGWFGGRGFNGYEHYLMQVRGVPAPFAVLAILAEFFGALGLILGLLSRVAALGIATNMVVAISLAGRRSSGRRRLITRTFNN
jgi:putative oxidoreductase